MQKRVGSHQAFSSISTWRAKISETMFGVEIQADPGVAFSATLSMQKFGDIALVRTSQSPLQSYSRTARAISDDLCNDLVIFACLRGTQVIRQRAREIVLRPGNCLALRVGEAYDWECAGVKDAIILQMPSQAVANYGGDFESLGLRRIECVNGWGAVLFSTLKAVHEAGYSTTLPPPMVARQILDLVSMSLGNASHQPAEYREGMHSRIVSLIGERCAEEGLAPADVATEMRISLRTLHRTLAARGHTFCDALHDARIGKAKLLLGASPDSALPIGAVAAAAGFSDPSHFARRFRQALGMSPTFYRRLAGNHR